MHTYKCVSDTGIVVKLCSVLDITGATSSQVNEKFHAYFHNALVGSARPWETAFVWKLIGTQRQSQTDPPFYPEGSAIWQPVFWINRKHEEPKTRNHGRNRVP